MKMHGLGNDFVIVDARAQNRVITPALAQGIAHRQFGVGFDQLAVIRPGSGDAHLEFWNSDGTTAGACGNATRCIARYLLDETGKESLVSLALDRGSLQADKEDATGKRMISPANDRIRTGIGCDLDPQLHGRDKEEVNLRPGGSIDAIDDDSRRINFGFVAWAGKTLSRGK